MKKFLKRIFQVILGIVLLLIIGAVIFVYTFTHKSLPEYDGTFYLKGLKDTVFVYRDSLGVPHIYAKNDIDLYRTLGYITAQERFWQMDLIRRITQGRISEIFGKDFVDVDLKLRALRIEEKSEKIWTTFDDTLKTIVEAYADGINQYIENNPLPIEFRLIGYKPDKWKPIHSLNLIGYMAWDLGMAWSNEITLFKIKQILGDSLISLFVPNFSEDSIIYKGFDLNGYEIDNEAIAFNKALYNLGAYPFIASNNWVVSGKKSTTGKPILCNDMHLGFGIPGIWMQVDMHSPDINVTGVVVPGSPFVVAGHNQNIAWGMTNVMLDDADFYIETLNEDSTKYLVDGQWRDLVIKKYKIITSDGDTLTKILRFTHRGPIISYFKHVNKALSMSWIGNLLSNEVKGLYIINKAKNWDEFRQGCKYFGSVAQNIIFADVNGNIGIQMTGTVPKRTVSGWHIYDGSTTKQDWHSFISFDSLPYVYNPKDGFLVSANNKSSNNVNYYISIYYHQDYRFDRITEFLRSKDKLSVEDMKQIQNDYLHSEFVKEYLPDFIFEITSNLPSGSLAKQVINIMKNWNGDMDVESPAPLIFEQFFMSFIKNSIGDELGDEILNDIFSSTIMVEGVIRNLWHDKFSPIYDNIETENKETFVDIVKLSMKQTIDTLVKQLGSNPNKWHYGDIHTLTLEHPIGSKKILDWVFNLNRGPFAVGGSYHTVCPYSYGFINNFKVKSGASERHIFDLNNWDNSQTVIPTGTSGQPASEFYCNQTQMYINGKYHQDVFSKTALMPKVKYTAVFVP